MNTITQKTFPGVYTSISDESFETTAVGPFRPGLVGVASKGPFNVPTTVISLADYINQFGNPVTTTYASNSNNIVTPNGAGFFLADAVDALADNANAISIVRVGNQFTDLAPSDGYSSGGNAYLLYSPNNAPRVRALLAQNNGSVYLRVVQAGKPSTVNIAVTSAGGGTIALSRTQLANGQSGLAAVYTAATIGYSPYANAANTAEGVLMAYTYGSNSSQLTDNPYTLVGSITGNKNDFQFWCSSNATAISVGDVYKIMQTNCATSHEVRVKSTLINYGDTSGTIFLERSDLTQLGYQAVPLQDTYSSAVLYKATGETLFARLKAATAGTWANGEDSTQGLYLKVRPGSAAGSKKLEVYWNSSLAETYDNLSDNPNDAVNSWTVRLAMGISSYVYYDPNGSGDGYSNNPTAANTVNPWDARFYNNPITPSTTGLPVPMPVGAINAGWLALTPGNVSDTGGQFTNGYNGENPQDSDWIGDLDTNTDTLTGLRAFEQSDLSNVNVIAAPQDNISVAVMQQMGITAGLIKAVSIADVPAGLTARQAVDWSNGKLPSQSGYRVDSPNLAIYWNWFTRSNSFGETKLVPPTLGVLAAMAVVFNIDYPWSAVAGLNRGQVTSALSVQYNYIPDDVKQSMYGNGQSVNPILNINNAYYIFGERTMQVAESKLTALHNVIMVNWLVTGMANIAKNYVFDPNDQQLLTQLSLAFTAFIDSIVNERGIEQYNLVMDSTNNNAATRNARCVIIALAVIPTDVAERFFINASVFESGAIIVNSIQ